MKELYTALGQVLQKAPCASPQQGLLKLAPHFGNAHLHVITQSMRLSVYLLLSHFRSQDIVIEVGGMRPELRWPPWGWPSSGPRACGQAQCLQAKARRRRAAA